MTTTPAGDDIVPRFIEGRAGRLFVTYFPPATAVNPKRAVIFVPPFAEEMNRWRPMAARMARQLAQIGWGAALVDLLGTGDSEGDFAEASWDIWRNDVRAASDWLCGRGVERQALLGLRLGGLLALDCAADLAGRLDRVILWQPVLRGAVMMTQFLRIRLAAGMNAAGGEKETTASLRTRLADRETIEVAGYALTGALTQAIDELDLARLAPAAGCRSIGSRSKVAAKAAFPRQASGSLPVGVSPASR